MNPVHSPTCVLLLMGLCVIFAASCSDDSQPLSDSQVMDLAIIDAPRSADSTADVSAKVGRDIRCSTDTSKDNRRTRCSNLAGGAFSRSDDQWVI